MKYSRHSRILSLLLCLCLLWGTLPAALAEGEETPGEDTPEPQNPVVSFDSESPAATLGQSATLTAAVAPADGLDIASWTWVNEDPSVADISWDTTSTASSSTLTITPIKTGQTKLTATVNINGATSISAECTLTVFPPAATAITLDRTALRIDENGTDVLTVKLNPDNADMTAVSCESNKTAVCTVSLDKTTGIATVKAVSPGEATLTFKTGALTPVTCTVTVPGVVLSSNSLSLLEGNTATLTADSYGVDAPSYEWTSSKPEVVRVIDGQVTAMSTGTATITVQIRNTSYQKNCTVTVSPNTAGVITATASAARPLSFSSVESQIDDRCRTVLGARLDHVSGLTVPTSAGILLHKYVSSDNPGAGVGSSEIYWVDNRDGGKLLSDISFVPDGSWGGDTEISYTGYASDGRSFKGTIRVSVDKINDVVYSTGPKTPLAFSVGDFNTVCRGRTSRDLEYVTFTLPSSTRGTLYLNYSAGSSYNTPVEESVRYYRTTAPYLSGITFVPTDGYTGTFTISYTAWDTSGYSYTGRVSITVSGISGGGGTGDVNYSIAMGKSVTFRASDFNSVCRNATGYALEYIRFTELPSSSRGGLYYNYNASDGYTDYVTTGQNYYYNGVPSLSRVTFAAASGFSGTVNLSFTGQNAAGDRFSGTVSITVGSGNDYYDGEILYTTSRNQAVEMNADDFSNYCRDTTGRSLSRVQFDLPASSRGELYYDYSSNGNYDRKVTSSSTYYRDAVPYLSWVSFVPASGYEGSVSFGFTGWDSANERFTGTVTVKVGSSSSSTGGRNISYTTSRGRAVTLDTDDFDNASRGATGRSVDRVRFDLPASSRGDLYYSYSDGSYDNRVSASTSYFRSSSPYLSRITFVPASGYEGKVSFGYTAWDTAGDSFTGTVTITVGYSSASGSSLSYSTRGGQAVAMDEDDFNQASRDATGLSLDYVRFELPSSSKGELYYNYSNGSYDNRVSASTNYYRNSGYSNSVISKVFFVPASGFTGTASFSFTGWNTSGDRFTGTVTVSVETGRANVSYTAATGKPLTLDGDDFNLAGLAVTRNSLRYLRFELPDANKGTLYYNYSDGSFDNRVSASTSYYRSTNPTISKVTFVPAAGFEGDVSFGFTGWDTSGNRFTGTVTITYKPAPPADVVRYTAGSEPVAFDSEDFYDVCAKRGAGSFVSLAFTLPDASYGRLYYGYTGPSRYESVVKSTTVYLRGGAPDLSRVSFLPKAGFSGLVVIPYTASDSGGETYSGTVEITVTPPTQSTHFQDLGKYAWAVPSVEFLYGYGVISGAKEGQFAPVALMTRGDFILMLYRAFRFGDSGTESFIDVPSDSYYAEAIAAAKALGIAQGSADGRFHPSDPLTRQDAAVTLQRAMRAVGWTLNDGTSADLALYADGSTVSSYAVGAVACMVRSGVLLGDGASRLNPFGSLTRAELTVMLHRALTL